MAASDFFEVRLNRFLLLFLILFSLLFIAVGCTLAGWADFITFDETASRGFMLNAAMYFFFLFLPAVIIVNCAWYLLFPPLMLRVDEKGITFATSMRYVPKLFPWSAYESAQIGADISSMTSFRQFFVGAQISFKKDAGVPMGLATSAGLGYYFHRLTISPLYANRLPGTIVAETKRLAAKFTAQ